MNTVELDLVKLFIDDLFSQKKGKKDIYFFCSSYNVWLCIRHENRVIFSWNDNFVNNRLAKPWMDLALCFNHKVIFS